MKTQTLHLPVLFVCCLIVGIPMNAAGQARNSAESQGNSQKIVNHRWRSDDCIATFFDDSTALLTDNILADEGQGNMTTYKEYPGYLRTSEEFEIRFFDDFGHIDPGWEVINRYRIYSNRQITNLIADLSQANFGEEDNVQYIDDTFLIVLPLKAQHFEDEDSEEARNYFILADDRANYVYETTSKFEKMGIETIYAKERFLFFTLYDGESIAVDTQAEQNGTGCAALLYRKGYIPIMIDIVGSDEENEQIENYLSESGDGPPFERWRADSGD